MNKIISQTSKSAVSESTVPTKKAFTGRALYNRNLQLYFAGQIISMIGTWMQQVALSWLVYRLTNSSYMLGVVGFASMAPSLFLTPFAGILADRFDRHRLVIITQLLSCLQAGTLAILVFSGNAQLWQLIALSTALGVIGAFDMPARQTFLVDMLEDNSQLPSAIAINSSITTLTRLLGPFIAGVFVAKAGEGMCFLVNAVSYLAVVAALLFVKPKPNRQSSVKQKALAQMKEGFVYAFGFPPIRTMLLLLAFTGLFSMSFTVLMPVFAKDIFHGNASTLGLLTGASGFGSVLGALFIGSRRGVQKLGKWILIGCLLFGLSLVALGCTKSLVLALPVLAATGFGSMVLLAGSNTVLQTIVDEDKRGRVMSIFFMAFMGLAPFGAMASGALAGKIGADTTVLASGLLTIALGLSFASRISQIHTFVKAIAASEGILEAEAESLS